MTMSNDGIDLRVLCIVRNFSSNSSVIKKTEIVLDGARKVSDLFEEVGDRFEYESSSFQLILEKRSDGVYMGMINLDQHLNHTLENIGFSLSLESRNHVQIEDKNGKPPRKKESVDTSQSNSNPSYGLRPSTSLPMLTNGPSNYPSYLNSPSMSSTSFLEIFTNLNKTESPVIIIKCNGGQVEAKKILLSAVSGVFLVMLESNMLEKHTHFVQADDIDFETMNIIMGFYKEGTVPDYKTLNREHFTYIVEKYNFLGIKEEIAENVLQDFYTCKNIQVWDGKMEMDLESIFSTFACQRYKKKAIASIADRFIKGLKIPDFTSDFSISDFLALSTLCCSALNSSKNLQYENSLYIEFLETLCNWLYKDPKERSMEVLGILGMMDTFKISRFINASAFDLFSRLALCKQKYGRMEKDGRY